MRQRELSNRTFNGYEDIVRQVSRAWNVFRLEVERVKSYAQKMDKLDHLINVNGLTK